MHARIGRQKHVRCINSSWARSRAMPRSNPRRRRRFRDEAQRFECLRRLRAQRALPPELFHPFPDDTCLSIRCGFRLPTTLHDTLLIIDRTHDSPQHGTVQTQIVSKHRRRSTRCTVMAVDSLTPDGGGALFLHAVQRVRSCAQPVDKRDGRTTSLGLAASRRSNSPFWSSRIRRRRSILRHACALAQALRLLQRPCSDPRPSRHWTLVVPTIWRVSTTNRSS